MKLLLIVIPLFVILFLLLIEKHMLFLGVGGLLAMIIGVIRIVDITGLAIGSVIKNFVIKVLNLYITVAEMAVKGFNFEIMSIIKARVKLCYIFFFANYNNSCDI